MDTKEMLVVTVAEDGFVPSAGVIGGIDVLIG